jgi:hypothetical protein
MAHVAECLSSKCEALSSNPNSEKKRDLIEEIVCKSARVWAGP